MNIEHDPLAGLPEGSFTIRWDGYRGYVVSDPGLERATVVPADAYRGAVEALRKIADGSYPDPTTASGRRNFGPRMLRKIATDALERFGGQA